jgi:hypothetical protein
MIFGKIFNTLVNLEAGFPEWTGLAQAWIIRSPKALKLFERK